MLRVIEALFERLYIVFVVFFGIVGTTLILGPVVGVWRLYDFPSASMEPTLSKGGFGIASAIPYWLAPPKRGDVVIFRHRQTEWVKRIIGLPDDTVQLRNGVVFLNGKAIPKQKTAAVLSADQAKPIDKTEQKNRFEETLPEGVTYFVLDQRDDDYIDNTKVFKVPTDHYFVLGDNRDNSNDSRFPVVGFISKDQIERKLMVSFSF